jgi:hypothetical protein
MPPKTDTATPRSEKTDSDAVAPEVRMEANVLEDTKESGSAAGRTAVRIVTAPVAVAQMIADDVATTASRPDAVLYWGGVAGLALLGVIDWPVAAIAGVGVAVANGRRRSRDKHTAQQTAGPAPVPVS